MGGLFGGGQKSQPQVVYQQQPVAAATPAPAAATSTDAQTKGNTTDAAKLQAAKRSTLLSEADSTTNKDLLGS